MNKDKVVLVTGSSRGIGKATIIEFASRGYNVVINYINSEKAALELKQYVEEKFNVKSLALCCDISNEKEVKTMIDTIIDTFGRIDILVNNAGIVFDRNFEDITVSEFERTLKTNVIGAFITSREVSKYMKGGYNC